MFDAILQSLNQVEYLLVKNLYRQFNIFQDCKYILHFPFHSLHLFLHDFFYILPIAFLFIHFHQYT
jgi:hypothetical protein